MCPKRAEEAAFAWKERATHGWARLPRKLQAAAHWAEGNLEIDQEHLASNTVVDFLTSMWRSVRVRSNARTVVCACLPGEQHVLGLHMAATVLAFEGWRVQLLGDNTPLDSLVRSTSRLGAEAICIGSSPVVGRASLDRLLGGLCDAVDPGVELWLGGATQPEE